MPMKKSFFYVEKGKLKVNTFLLKGGKVCSLPGCEKSTKGDYCSRLHFRQHRSMIRTNRLLSEGVKKIKEGHQMIKDALDSTRATSIEEPSNLNLKEAETSLINQAMEEAGSQKDASKLLGITPRVLNYKLKELK